MPVLLLILLGAVAVLAALSIPVYFAARRPRRGTTEWMHCIETPHFRPLQAARLCAADCGWLPLAVVLAAGGRLLAELSFASIRGAGALALSYLPQYARSVLPLCALLAAGTYLLVRELSGSALAAVCAAIVLTLLQADGLGRAAVTVWALLFLWQWVCTGSERYFLPALWLTLSLVCFSAGLFGCARLLWLAPLWIAAWIYVQLRRRSLGRAAGSLLLTALLCALLTVGLCGLRLLRERYAGQGLSPIATAEFWRAVPPLLVQKLRQLGTLPAFAPAYSTDGLLALAGGAALLCALHGAIRRRESVCLALLVLLPFFAAVWLLGGRYLLNVPLALALGWLWGLWARREQTIFVILSVLLLLVTDCIILLL